MRYKIITNYALAFALFSLWSIGILQTTIERRHERLDSYYEWTLNATGGEPIDSIINDPVKLKRVYEAEGDYDMQLVLSDIHELEEIQNYANLGFVFFGFITLASLLLAYKNRKINEIP